MHALGAMTGGQAVQMVKAGLEAIYLSGWQVAGDANLAGRSTPTRASTRPTAVPAVVRRINNALRRADQIDWAEGEGGRPHWLAPIVADAEAGFGGPLNAFELMKAMIEAGAAGVHFEDQLASEKKCGHMGGKVLVPTSQHIRTLTAARLAADVLGVPTIVVARTDSLGATLLTSDVDERDRPFLTGERTAEGFFHVRSGLDVADRPRRWPTPRTPTSSGARRRRPTSTRRSRSPRPSTSALPGQDAGVQLLAVVQLEEAPGRRHHRPVPEGAGRDGLQVPVHHAGRVPRPQRRRCSSWPGATPPSGMTAYVALQEREFAMESAGYTATRHQREVGAGYFDDVATVISGGTASTLALEGSTEQAQF